jgi:small conductance mechanosensitive channel
MPRIRRDKAGTLPWRSPRALHTRTEEWRQVGLGSEIDPARAHKAQRGTLLLAALIAGVLVAFSRRGELFPGWEAPIQIVTVVLVFMLGSALAREGGQALGPVLYRRLDPGAAGSIGFIIRLVTILVVGAVALRIAGLRPETLAVGGAATAILLGLAAQQTLGNLFAGLVLLGNRPFRMGERVKIQAGALAGQVDGVVGSLGLFYTTLISGADRIMVPNSVVLSSAVVPLREPDRVELRARFDSSTTPAQVQQVVERNVEVPLRYSPHISVEEIDGDEVLVRIVATPLEPSDGAELTTDVLRAVRDAKHTHRVPAPASNGR